ncbi:MAG: hypothetical protein IT293_05580 [Deltaproteobacteria bacterium]|nr:hypothetical protein [Deltaproteobacteria bacterium]
MGRLSVARGLLLAAAAVTTAGAAPLQNGAFTAASDGMPTGWRLEAWARDLSEVGWEAAGDGSGIVRIVNRGPNDARLCQTIPVTPGASYRVSARVKTESVGLATAGALIAIEPRIADSVDVKGTQDWQRVEVSAQSGDLGSWDVCLRLGSYANLNTGTAWFADVRIDVLGGAPRAAGREWPSVGWAQMLATFRRTPWMQTALPLVAGLVLAFGLGVFGRRAR